MLQGISLGQFFPGTSVLHRLDPRIKIGILLLLMILAFCCDTGAACGILVAATASLILVSRVPLRLFLGSIRPLWWILVFTFLIHAVSDPGEEITRVMGFSITWEGIRQGGYVSLRLILLILLSSLLTFTTSPLKLTDAMEKLLSPGKRIGIPAHELAMMMTIALRFVPTLIEETDKIMKAQSARGSDFSTGNLLARLKCLVPVLVPLFLSAFRRADELAMAMEARCYRGGEGRTHMREPKISEIDCIACGAALLLAGVLVFLQWYA